MNTNHPNVAKLAGLGARDRRCRGCSCVLRIPGEIPLIGRRKQQRADWLTTSQSSRHHRLILFIPHKQPPKNRGVKRKGLLTVPALFGRNGHCRRPILNPLSTPRTILATRTSHSLSRHRSLSSTALALLYYVESWTDTWQRADSASVVNSPKPRLSISFV